MEGGEGLSTRGGVDGVCSLGRGQASRSVHWGGPGVPVCPLGRAGAGSRPWACRPVAGCVLGAGRAGCPCLPSGSLHFRCALLPTHLTRGHGCVREGVLPPPWAPGSHQVVAVVCALRQLAVGGGWAVGGLEHSGEGEPGEQAAAWKKRLVTGAGGWVSGQGALGCKVAGLSRVGCLSVFRDWRKHLVLSKNPL